jgi:broad specificity phosphatase PhoE
VLILVRHGQTEANAEGRLLGRMESPLTDLGRRQAAAVVDAVSRSGARPARVVASPRQRALQTAAGFPVPFEADERWAELDYGEYDGVRLGEVPPELWSNWRADPGFVPPGGESLAALGARVRAACEALAEAARRDDVVVVSHVSPIKAAVAWALGVGDGVAWRMRLDTASICRIAVGPAGPTLLTFNEVGHLNGLQTVTP